MTEEELLSQVLQFARLHGWLTFHARPARTMHGWRTAGSGDVVGFPDLILVRGRRLLAAELKSDRGRLTTAQEQWLQALEDAGVSVYCWHPADWPEIERTLRRELP